MESLIIIGNENSRENPSEVFCVLWMALILAVIFAIAACISLVIRIICSVRILMIFLPFNSTVKKT